MNPQHLAGRQIDGLDAAEFSVAVRARAHAEMNIVAARRNLGRATRRPAMVGASASFERRWHRDTAA